MMLQRILLSLLFPISLLHVKAQESSNVQLKLEAGFDLAKPGLFLNLEPKVRTTKNTVIGLRVGVMAYSGSKSVNTLNTQTMANNRDFEYEINEKAGNGIISLTPTFDYHIKEKLFRKKHIFHPYLGFGVGYYILASDIELTQISRTSPTREEIKARAIRQIGLLARGGIKFDKLVIGLEYNFTPDADIKLDDCQKIGTVDLSFIALCFGFRIDLGGKTG